MSYFKENNKNIRLKFLFSKRIGGAWGNEPYEGNAIVCIRAADFDTDKMSHKTTDLTRRSFQDDEIRNKELQEGDLIIEKSGGGENQPVGRVVKFSFNEIALCSNFLEVLRPNKTILYTEFGAYLLYSLWASRFVTTSIKQTTGIQNLDLSALLDYKVLIPEVKNQIEISNFLNEEVVYIDKLVDIKEKLIELLSEKRQALISQAIIKSLNTNIKIKDSGIDWLGKLPEHWDIKKIKYVTKKVGSGITPKGGAEVYVKEGIPLLRSQNIHFDGLRLDEVAFISKKIHDSMSNSKVEAGDVLLNITGASIGRCYYYDGQFQEANVNQHVCILRPNEKVLTKYLYLFFVSDFGQNQISVSQVGGGREGLNFEELKSFVIPLPTLKEQQEIINTLQKETDKIDKLKDATLRSIELLKERRTALITAAVSGQIEIPSGQ